MELNQIVEDLLSRQILLSERPWHRIDDFFALLEQGFPHFHELGSLDDTVPVSDFACSVGQGRHLEALASLIAAAGHVGCVDAQWWRIFASVLGP